MGGSVARAGLIGVQRFIEFWYPPICPGCDRGLVADGAGACGNCLAELRTLAINPQDRCERCFQSLDRSGFCEYCRSRPVFFDRHLSLAPMQGLWREVVHRWKYENDRRLWRLFWDFEPGLTRCQERVMELRQAGIDRIVWIDSGSSGRQLRNFQPCADIAGALASILEPVCGSGADLRKRKGRQQSGQGFVDRFFALHDSLEYCGSGAARRCLLVEDVFTTGATANEAARILKKNGALQVIVFSLLLRDGRAG